MTATRKLDPDIDRAAISGAGVGDSVADHGYFLPRLMKLGYLGRFVSWEHLGDDGVDAQLAGDPAGGRFVVPGEPWNIYPSRCVDRCMSTYTTVPEAGTTHDPPSLSPFPGIDEARKLAALTQALGDPVRLQILATLEAVCVPVGTIVEATGLRQPAVSHHLRVLRDRGLVRGGDGAPTSFTVLPRTRSRRR